MSTSLRFGAAALAAIFLSIGLAVLVPAPAGATPTHGAVATPANDGPHPWPTDGCSASPERGPGWNFHHGCVHHDGCYRGHWASRRTCDSWFLRDLRASCRHLHPGGGFGRWACELLAAVYHAAVRAFGAPAYAAHLVTVPVR
jgi:Prokaryotic phospholipase A2